MTGPNVDQALQLAPLKSLVKNSKLRKTSDFDIPACVLSAEVKHWVPVNVPASSEISKSVPSDTTLRAKTLTNSVESSNDVPLTFSDPLTNDLLVSTPSLLIDEASYGNSKPNFSWFLPLLKVRLKPPQIFWCRHLLWQLTTPPLATQTWTFFLFSPPLAVWRKPLSARQLALESKKLLLKTSKRQKRTNKYKTNVPQWAQQDKAFKRKLIPKRNCVVRLTCHWPVLSVALGTNPH